MRTKRKVFFMAVMSLVLLVSSFTQVIVLAGNTPQTQFVNPIAMQSETTRRISDFLMDDVLVINEGNNDHFAEEPVHPPIEDLYEQLQEHDRIYDGDGGFYELVPISDLISEDDLERVIDELNDENYAIITDWALFNIDGDPLPTPRTHVVRHQRFLGTPANSQYFFRHVPGFNADGYLPPTTSGNGWRLQTWQINIGGTWVRAFCTGDTFSYKCVG